MYPAASYKVTLIPGEGVFEDVSDTKLVVGSINSTAVAMQLGGPVVNLHQGGAPYSAAHAVNNRNQIVGHINFGAPWAPDLRPAFWKGLGAQPMRLPYPGEAMDLNDAGITVGVLQRSGRSEAFAWDVTGVTGTSLHVLPAFVADQGGQMTVLPMPNNPNGFAWRASYGYGINSCGIVVGTAWPFPGNLYTAQPIVWNPGC